MVAGRRRRIVRSGRSRHLGAIARLRAAGPSSSACRAGPDPVARGPSLGFHPPSDHGRGGRFLNGGRPPGGFRTSLRRPAAERLAGAAPRFRRTARRRPVRSCSDPQAPIRLGRSLWTRRIFLGPGPWAIGQIPPGPWALGPGPRSAPASAVPLLEPRALHVARHLESARADLYARRRGATRACVQRPRAGAPAVLPRPPPEIPTTARVRTTSTRCRAVSAAAVAASASDLPRGGRGTTSASCRTR